MADSGFHPYTFTKPVILFYPKSLFIAQAFERDGKKGAPTFRGTFGIAPDHPDYKPFRDLVINAAKLKWPGVDLGAKDAFGKSLITWPWKDGTKEADKTKAKAEAKGKTGEESDRQDFMRGKLILYSKSSEDKPPAFAGIVNGKVTRLEGPMLTAQKDKLFFFGAEVIPAVVVKIYDGNDAIKPSVTCYLNSILGTGAGKKIGGGRPSVEETYAGYAGHAVAENPTSNTEIPF